MSKLFDLVIFGGTGDLARRKLVPALFHGLSVGAVSPDSRIILTTRSLPEEGVTAWLKTVLSKASIDCKVTPKRVAAFLKCLDIIELSLVDDTSEWKDLAGLLKDQADRPLIHFLAIPPSLFTSTCSLLGKHGLNCDRAKVVLEKPIGHDRVSAEETNARVAEEFNENQTFRIDHYLGKEAVQNLLVLRFSNFMFEELWNAHSIDNIQITVAETVGVEGRGGYYDQSGALRDMVQNHILQLLCLVAMEPPSRLNADCIRDEKLKVLKALQRWTPELLDKNVVRGQYSSGFVDGERVGSYADDLALESPSSTESYVAIKTYIENWRWAGVPFYLRTGKRLPSRFAEIVIQFRDIPHAASRDWGELVQPNRFIIRMQPEDRLSIRMMVKNQGGDEEALKEVELNLDVTATADDAVRLGPYLRLILAAAAGDQSLFVHRDEVDEAWRWIDEIIEGWQAPEISALKAYAPDSWGPDAAKALMSMSQRHWFRDEVGQK